MSELIKLENLEEVYVKFGLTENQILNKFRLAGREDYARFYALPIEQHFKCGGKNGLYCFYLYFAIASLVLKNVKNILEIGTGSTGGSTNLLARLFPKATVYTIDVNEVKGEFKENIKKSNIKFIKSDSTFLSSLDLPKSFELCWIDGAVSYPQVKNDIMFAYNHLRRGGFLIKSLFGPLPNIDISWAVEEIRDIIKEQIFIFPQYTNAQQSWARVLRVAFLEKI